MTDYQGPLPQPTPETKPFWDGLKERRLTIQRCNDCGKPYFYPRPFCPSCFSRNVSWFEASGKGKLYTFVINYRPPPFLGKEPSVLAVVELDEGPRMMTTLVGADPDPAHIHCDAPVTIEYDDVTDEVTLPRFRLS